MARRNGVFIPDDDGEWYYRGVEPNHPMIAAARQRVIVPGARNGTLSPQLHNDGRPTDLAVSPFSSWTTRLDLAIDFADDPPGVVLRLPRFPMVGDGWSWEWSPDDDNENEVLLRGVRIDAEVEQ